MMGIISGRIGCLSSLVVIFFFRSLFFLWQEEVRLIAVISDADVAAATLACGCRTIMDMRFPEFR